MLIQELQHYWTYNIGKMKKITEQMDTKGNFIVTGKWFLNKIYQRKNNIIADTLTRTKDVDRKTYRELIMEVNVLINDYKGTFIWANQYRYFKIILSSIPNRQQICVNRSVLAYRIPPRLRNTSTNKLWLC